MKKSSVAAPVANLILVGRVAGAFGTRGEVRITAYTEEPLALLRYRTLKRKNGTPALSLVSARGAKGGVIARAEEVTTKEAADVLRGLELYVPREALPPTEEDEFYIADLVGLAAFTPDGDPLGRVKAVHDFGAGDILEIDPPDGRAAIWLPFTREAVPGVDVPGGRLTAVLPADADDAASPSPHPRGGGVPSSAPESERNS
jgi:16S rRNA processing protein RimM